MPHEQVPNQNLEDTERQREISQQREQSALVGAKILTTASFDTRHKEIVDSSFNKAREKGEKLLGKNNERRNYAYVSRLENLIDKRGNALEKRLWRGSMGRLIVQPEDISDAYWRTQEQILRDNGQGHELSQAEKDILTHEIQEQQRDSLKPWANYLGSEQSPYPMWFKLYAWDGMSKMGVFDTTKNEFAKRSKGSVAPYPKLNQAALAKLYGAICQVYNIEQPGHEDNNENEVLKGLVKSGNFNKLYSQLLLDSQTTVKTPERAEDVRGEWKEYLPGDEEALSKAAVGTSWCVASPVVARNYLEYGSYSGNAFRYTESKAKFILFHLQNPDTGALADSACASIRLDADGEVAEISGLQDGQALDDSLVPTVEEKVKTLPGGEKFLAALADKKYLIALDRKMQGGQPFSQEDIDFIFEAKRPINTLDTYNDSDPRLGDLRDLDKLLSTGTDGKILFPYIEKDNVSTHLKEFLESGVKIADVLAKTDAFYVARDLDTLAKHGALIGSKRDLEGYGIDLELLSEEYDTDTVPDYFAEFVEDEFEAGDDAGEPRMWLDQKTRRQLVFDAMPIPDGAEVAIDVGQLAQHIYPEDLLRLRGTLKKYGLVMNDAQIAEELMPLSRLRMLDTLAEYGVQTDINKLARQLGSRETSGHFEELVQHGAQPENLLKQMGIFDVLPMRDTLAEKYGIRINIDNVIDGLDADTIFNKFHTLTNAGADANKLFARIPSLQSLESSDIWSGLDAILSAGVNPDKVIAKMSPVQIESELSTLLHYHPDPDKLLTRLGERGIRHRIDTLLENSEIEVSRLVPYVESDLLVEKLDTFLAYGADVDAVVRQLNSADVAENLDLLLGHNANAEGIVAKLTPEDVSDNLETLLETGVSASALVAKMQPDDIIYNLDILEDAGAKDIDLATLAPNLSADTTMENLDLLSERGVKIDIKNLVGQLNSYTVAHNFDRLQELGVTPGELASRLNAKDLMRLFDKVTAAGVSNDDILNKLSGADLLKYANILKEHGVDEKLIRRKAGLMW